MKGEREKRKKGARRREGREEGKEGIDDESKESEKLAQRDEIKGLSFRKIAPMKGEEGKRRRPGSHGLRVVRKEREWGREVFDCITGCCWGWRRRLRRRFPWR